MNRLAFVLLLTAVFAARITEQKLLNTEYNDPDEDSCYHVWYQNTGRIEAEYNPDCLNCAPCKTSFKLGSRWKKCSNSNYNKRTCSGYWNVPIKESTEPLIATLDEIWAKAKRGEGCIREAIIDTTGGIHIAEVPTDADVIANVCGKTFEKTTTGGWNWCAGTSCSKVSDGTIISELDALHDGANVDCGLEATFYDCTLQISEVAADAAFSHMCDGVFEKDSEGGWGRCSGDSCEAVTDSVKLGELDSIAAEIYDGYTLEPVFTADCAFLINEAHEDDDAEFCGNNFVKKNNGDWQMCDIFGCSTPDATTISELDAIYDGVYDGYTLEPRFDDLDCHFYIAEVHPDNQCGSNFGPQSDGSWEECNAKGNCSTTDAVANSELDAIYADFIADYTLEPLLEGNCEFSITEIHQNGSCQGSRFTPKDSGLGWTGCNAMGFCQDAANNSELDAIYAAFRAENYTLEPAFDENCDFYITQVHQDGICQGNRFTNQYFGGWMECNEANACITTDAVTNSDLDAIHAGFLADFTLEPRLDENCGIYVTEVHPDGNTCGSFFEPNSEDGTWTKCGAQFDGCSPVTDATLNGDLRVVFNGVYIGVDTFGGIFYDADKCGEEATGHPLYPDEPACYYNQDQYDLCAGDNCCTYPTASAVDCSTAEMTFEFDTGADGSSEAIIYSDDTGACAQRFFRYHLTYTDGGIWRECLHEFCTLDTNTMTMVKFDDPYLYAELRQWYQGQIP